MSALVTPPAAVESARQRVIDAALDLRTVELRGEYETDAWWDAKHRLADAADLVRALLVADESTCTYHGGCAEPVDPTRDDQRCEHHAPSRRWP